MADIDGRLFALQRSLDDVDRAHDASTEAPRLGQNDLKRVVRAVRRRFLQFERLP
uniref:hypothetical protein n=1 Tax=Sphingomonas sp. TaxID=28214 RepID=UPI0025EA848C|nr:hypothetical protein [Sphingomonas sp.]